MKHLLTIFSIILLLVGANLLVAAIFPLINPGLTGAWTREGHQVHWPLQIALGIIALPILALSFRISKSGSAMGPTKPETPFRQEARWERVTNLAIAAVIFAIAILLLRNEWGQRRR